MKDYFKNMPIEVTQNEFQQIAKILYASFQAMASKNKMIYLIDSKDKKVYGFDSVIELDRIKEYGSKNNFHLIQIL